MYSPAHGFYIFVSFNGLGVCLLRYTHPDACQPCVQLDRHSLSLTFMD
jgi:hypothetical protein